MAPLGKRILDRHSIEILAGVKILAQYSFTAGGTCGLNDQ